VLATTTFLLVKKDLSVAPRTAFGAAIVASLIAIGWIVERRKRAHKDETSEKVSVSAAPSPR
jgi:hypothetical protein